MLILFINGQYLKKSLKTDALVPVRSFPSLKIQCNIFSNKSREDDMDNLTCENCIYWKAVSEPKGVCRRYPPLNVILKDGVESSEWPETAGDSWCGEHKLKCFILGCGGGCNDREGPDV